MSMDILNPLDSVFEVFDHFGAAFTTGEHHGVETWVGLLRNGWCCINDLGLGGDGTWVIFAFLNKPATSITSMLGLNSNIVLARMFIGPLQACAVVFNGIGGLDDLASSVYTTIQLAKWRDVAEHNKFDAQLAAARSGAHTTLVVSFCKLVISFGFIWLTLSSFKLLEFVPGGSDLIQWGLFLMEIALVILLYIMTGGVMDRFANYKKSKALAQMVDANDKPAIKAAIKDLKTVPLLAKSVEVAMVDAPWPGPAADYLVQAYVAETAKFEKNLAVKLTKNKEAAADQLLANGVNEYYTALLDIVVIALNVVAFFGYAMFPLTYFFEEEFIKATLPFWPGNELAEWSGNFAGDFMWTLEPILVLTVPPVIASIREAYLGKLQAARKKDE